jgi:glyoxylase-like metal-dependent hydrolase (beta-lactamase superfamily II)
VLCTHGHFDHVGGAARLQAVYDVPVHLHRDDEKTVRSANFMMMAFKLAARITLPQFTWVEEGAVVRAGALQARYQAAPGHTPGSCLIHVGGVVFTGDTIYARGVGLVELPGESPARLRQSILAVWDTLDEWLEILPGHGPSSAFGDLKRENLPLRRFLELPAAAGEDRS